jgi:hypothetical protein
MLAGNLGHTAALRAPRMDAHSGSGGGAEQGGFVLRGGESGSPHLSLLIALVAALTGTTPCASGSARAH